MFMSIKADLERLERSILPCFLRAQGVSLERFYTLSIAAQNRLRDRAWLEAEEASREFCDFDEVAALEGGEW